MRVAEYLRMSTDHQRYSIANQQEFIRAFATDRGFTVVRTYADNGKSGLSIRRREGLQRLLSDVRNRMQDFTCVLVYDTSRWGRFQDPDEAAFYEWICRRAGYDIIYCAEPFERENGMAATIMKSIKRSMAAEFSRELGVKVSAGKRKRASQGFWPGGHVGLGQQRAIVGRDGAPRLLLERGDRKAIQTDRIIVVPGPAAEVELVRRIFTMFVDEGRSEHEIVATLNREGKRTATGGPWRFYYLQAVLTRERYMGDLIFGKTSERLLGPRTKNPPEHWVRVRGAFEPIVDARQFEEAQAIFARRRRRTTEEELLRGLANLLERYGRLSPDLIDADSSLPSKNAYVRRFGSLARAYALVGFQPRRGQTTGSRVTTRVHRRSIGGDIARRLEEAGAKVSMCRDCRRLTINGEFIVGLLVVYGRRATGGGHHWSMRPFPEPIPDFMIVVRLVPTTRAVLDYYAFPTAELEGLTPTSLRLGEYSPLQAYRMDELDCVAIVGAHTPLIGQDILEDVARA